MNVKVYGLIEGLMVYWDEVKNAAVYHVHLFIGDWNRRTEVINGRQTVVMDEKPKLQEIALVDVDRNFKFYSFRNYNFSQENLCSVHKELLKVKEFVMLWLSSLKFVLCFAAYEACKSSQS